MNKRMSVDELKAALVACDRAYVDHTGKQPYTAAKLNLYQSDEAWEADMWHVSSGPDQHITGLGDTPEAALADLTRIISEMPSHEEMQISEFRQDLANLIDKGNKYGIPVDFVNPLTETMKRLSENVITHDKRMPAE